ncbi:MAG: cytochrome c [Acidobacteriota bacterium]|nr:cytochrome c [Acidobacteriota bacterium]
MRTVLITAGTTLTLAVSAAALHGQTPQKTTNSAVYTAAQAVRGEAVFSERCSSCHDPARFTGAAFFDAFEGKALKEFWDISSGTMPEDNPGSLKPQEYGDIVAYVLKLNAFPAGEAELPGDAGAMANIKVEQPKQAGGGNPSGLPAQAAKSVKAGVYTAAQADRGQVVFRSKCASCHAPNRFTDDLFYTSFAGKPLWEMFDVISDTMPEEAPGTLKPEEYVDVMAYLLKLNSFPTGDTELPVGKDALSAILMEKP